MDIYWLGHSGVRLRSSVTGLSVICDPYPPARGVRIDPRQTQDVAAVTVSHQAPRHSAAADLPGNPRVFSSPGEYEFQGITVRAVMSPLAPDETRAARNVAYTIGIDGVNVCHLGNIRQPLTAQHIDLIGPADVVLAPAGGAEHNLLPHRAVNQTAQQLDARWLIPIHYRTAGEPAASASAESGESGDAAVQLQPDSAAAFLRELGVAEGTLEPQNRLQVTRNNLPAALQVALLTPHFRPL